MPAPVVVVTAKAHSTRLLGKNMLPLGGEPLAMWSIREAQRQMLETVVATDIPGLADAARKLGCYVVGQNPSLGHVGVIQAAVKDINRTDRPVILLQPTSPFRYGNIVFRCWQKYVEHHETCTVLSANTVHEARLHAGAVHNTGHAVELWDGNVAIYPPGRVGDYTQCQTVRNLPLNSLQIDTEEDYIMACASLELTKPVEPVLPAAMRNILSAILQQHGIVGEVTLVGRPDPTAAPIPQDKPVIYLNHCRGYTGGRCDALFLIANTALRHAGINSELRECALKARVVFIRHNGELPWVLSQLPEIAGKYYPIRESISRADDHLTTGAIAADTLTRCDLRVNFIGLYSPKNILQALPPFHYPAASREIGLLYFANVLRPREEKILPHTSPLLYAFVTHQKNLASTQTRVAAMMAELQCDDYVIVCGGATTKFDPHHKLLFLDCNDHYEGLPEKVFKLLQAFVHRPAFANYTHLCKLDDDMLVQQLFDADFFSTTQYGGVVFRGRGNNGWHLGRCSPDSPWNTTRYAGSFVPWCMGGNGYIVSRDAASKICDREDYKTHIYEDLAVAAAFRDVQIHPDAIDVRKYVKSPIHK